MAWCWSWGGYNGNNVLTSAELYDPASDTWSSAGSMAVARAYTATLLNNGMVLVTRSGSSAELYDPASNTWSSAGSNSSGGAGTATLLNNGMVLVAGGYGGVSSAELYDPVSNTWSSTGSMATGRSGQTATLLNNGMVLVTGGDSASGMTSSAELYDPASKTWSSAGSVGAKRVGHAATLLSNGKVLVTGGNSGSINLSSAMLYDPASNSWSRAQSMAAARYVHTSVLLTNGQVLVTGGFGDSGDGNLSSAELYDPANNTWSSAGSMTAARVVHTATLLGNGKVLVTGGSNHDDPQGQAQYLASAELYDPGPGVPDPTLCTISVTPATVPVGGTATVTLHTVDELGNPVAKGGSPFSFGLGAGTGSGTFSNLTDNHNGTYTATFTGTTAGPVTITAKLSNQAVTSTLPTVTVTPAVPTTLIITNLGATSVSAGSMVTFTVTAEDSGGKVVPGYTGTVKLTSTDGQAGLPAAYTFVSGDAGTHMFTVTLATAGNQTITVTDQNLASLHVATGPITVNASALNEFIVNALGGHVVTAGSAFLVTAQAADQFGNNIIVQAFDQFRNPATGYTGKVHLGSSDAKATFVPNDSTLTDGIGTFAVTLNTAGSQTITARDAVSSSPITISGTSAAIATSGLTVMALTNTSTGFLAAFSKALNPADLTIYGAGGAVQDVLLVGKNSNNGQGYPGTLIVDASHKLVTFNVASNFLVASSPGGVAALPDDTYTATLLSGSGSNGFQDMAGQGLDDGHGGHGDFVGTFTTSYQQNNTQVLGIPDFARGPNASGDTSTLIKVPNDPANGGHVGIPITIYNAANLTSAGFTLTYNANILTVTAGISDPSNAGATFKMTSNVLAADGIHSVATFAFSNATPLNGTHILGDITAYVPFAARSQYQVKDLLALSNITVNSGATVVPANAIDVNANFGDVNGDHHLDGLDKGLIANVASTANTGFSAFTLLDPAIIGDLSGDNAVTANSTSLLSNYLLAFPVAKIPALPNPPIADNLFTSPFAFDPTLSLPAAVQASSNGVVNVPVLLDHPRPAGSTGLVEAEMTLRYDPAVLSVTAADITLGSIPSQGKCWQLSAMVNAATGQITVQLYSQTPITSDQAGSLVTIAFHLKSSAGRAEKTTVQLLDSQTVLADAQAAMILSPGLDWTAVLTGDWVQSLI